MQRRSVVCRQMPEMQELDVDYTASSQTLPDIMCPAPKPSETRACSLAACPPEWMPGPWSQVRFGVVLMCYDNSRIIMLTNTLAFKGHMINLNHEDIKRFPATPSSPAKWRLCKNIVKRIFPPQYVY